jgi:predicted enzyme related to lactoylglutathione lyase
LQTQVLEISNITIAIENIVQMVKFYETVFNCKFSKIDLYGTTLFSGNLVGTKILLCPNEIAGVKAEKNRHQFDFKVANINEVILLAKAAGGEILNENKDSESQVISALLVTLIIIL